MVQKENYRGIYLLPNLFTTASLFAAFYSLLSSLKGFYDTAAIAIFISMIADGLDGRIARLTNSQTAFGAQYDSLSDLVAFGVAPALLIYSWKLQDLGKIGWLIAFFYTAAVALRLARFNTRIAITDHRYFYGLSCPAAAATICSFVWLCEQNHLNNFFITILMAFLTVITAVLMVTSILFYSFKSIDFKGRVPFLYLLIMVLLFMAIAAYPSLVLFTSFIIYTGSGPFYRIIILARRRKQKQREQQLNNKKSN